MPGCDNHLAGLLFFCLILNLLKIWLKLRALVFSSNPSAEGSMPSSWRASAWRDASDRVPNLRSLGQLRNPRLLSILFILLLLILIILRILAILIVVILILLLLLLLLLLLFSA